MEGRSAEAAVRAVARPNQKVFAMQGKPINAAKRSRRQVFQHPLYQSLVRTLLPQLRSVSSENAGPVCNDTELDQAIGYDRVCVLMDPDVDGVHCAALMVLFFDRLMPRTIRDGRLSLIEPPLYQMKFADDSVRYAWHPQQRDQIVRDRDGETVVHRYRSVAAMPPAVLRRTCVTRQTRFESEVTPEIVRSIASRLS